MTSILKTPSRNTVLSTKEILYLEQSHLPNFTKKIKIIVSDQCGVGFRCTGQHL